MTKRRKNEKLIYKILFSVCSPACANNEVSAVSEEKEIMKKVIYFTIIWFFIPVCFLYAEDGFTQRDRELLIELKVKMQEIDKRFEQVDKRFEQLDNRIDKRFEDMFNFLWILTVIFTTLTVSVIGFAYWDRRTMIRKAKEETIEEIEKRGLSTKLLEVLRERAKEDNKLADVLRQFHLL